MSHAAALLGGPQFRTKKRGQKLISSEEGVVEVILEALEHPEPQHDVLRLTPISPEKLWDLEGVRRDRSERLLAGKVVNQLNWTMYRLNLAACVGVLTRDGVYNLFMASAWNSWKQLSGSLKGSWRPIAVLFEREERGLLEQVPNPNHRVMEPEDVGKDDMEKLQKYSRRVQQHQWIVVYTAWMEYTGSDPYDKLSSEHNNTSNPSRSFFLSRELARAPSKVLDRYRRCEEIHRTFCSARYPDGVPHEDEMETPRLVAMPLPAAPRKRAPRVQKDNVVGTGTPVVKLRDGQLEAVNLPTDA